jgi:hypothetical protein
MIIAFVKWLDAVSGDDWYSAEEMNDKGAVCFSTGFLHSQDEHGVMLYLNHDRQNDLKSCTMFIPNGMILSLSLIEITNPALSEENFIPKHNANFKLKSLLVRKKEP